jgi:hypothetical protein
MAEDVYFRLGPLKYKYRGFEISLIMLICGITVYFFFVALAGAETQTRTSKIVKTGSTTDVDLGGGKHKLTIFSAPVRTWNGSAWLDFLQTDYIDGFYIGYTEIDKNEYIWITNITDTETSILARVCMNVTAQNDNVQLPLTKSGIKESGSVSNTAFYKLRAGETYCVWTDIKTMNSVKFGEHSTTFNIIRTSVKNGFYLTGTIGYPPLSGTYSAQGESGGLQYLGWYSASEVDIMGIPFNLTDSGVTGTIDSAVFQIMTYGKTGSNAGFNITLYMTNGSGETKCVIPPNLTAWNGFMFADNINTTIASTYEYGTDTYYFWDVKNEMQDFITAGYSCPVIGLRPGIPNNGYGGNYTRWWTSRASLNITYTAGGCTQVLANTTPINHANISCNTTDKLTLNWSWTQWDTATCGTFSNITWYNYSYVTCDYCVPVMANTTPVNHANISCNTSNILTLNWSWTRWDSSACVPDNVANVTWYNYSYVACDYCIPSMGNTTESAKQNTTHINIANISCNASDVLTLNWSWVEWSWWIEWDGNACGEVGNTTWYENMTWYNYTFETCDYCVPSIANTTVINHANISCNASNILTLNWSWTQWDTQACGEFNNITWYNYSYTSCDYCTPVLANTTHAAAKNTTCGIADTLVNWTWWVQWDTQTCGEFTNITWYSNNTLSCDYCQKNITNTSASVPANTSIVVTNGSCNTSGKLEYQTYNWTQWSYWTQWDTNKTTCCDITGIPGDCFTNITWYDNISWGNYTYNVNCTYVVPPEPGPIFPVRYLFNYWGYHVISWGRSEGLTDSTNYWLCTAADCSATCQVELNGGVITSCV